MSDRLGRLRREVERERRKAERRQRRPQRVRRLRTGLIAVALAAVAGAAIWLVTTGTIPGSSRSESAGPARSAPAPSAPAQSAPASGQPDDTRPAEGGLASPRVTVTPPAPDGEFPPPPDRARQELAQLTVAKNQGSSSYERSAFGPGWGGYGYYPKIPGGCEARDEVLRRDLSNV